VLVRGGGDLGTGAAVSLVRAGLDAVVVDREQPTALRLTAAFAAATLEGACTVGGVTGVAVRTCAEVRDAFARGQVAVWTGTEAALRDGGIRPRVLVEARMQGVRNPALSPAEAPIVIALGPGYVAGRHCHYVVETNRGRNLGAVIARGEAEAHTGIPGAVQGVTEERLLRSPGAGTLRRVLQIGDSVKAGDIVATVDGQPVRARIGGMVRGLMLDGLQVPQGKKVGDVDPRMDRALLDAPSDKSERVGAGVVAAIRAALVAEGG